MVTFRNPTWENEGIWKSQGNRSTWTIYHWIDGSIRLQNVVKYKEEGTLVYDSVISLLENGKLKKEPMRKNTVTVPNYVMRIIHLYFYDKVDITNITMDDVRKKNPLPKTAKEVIQALMRDVERNTLDLWELTSQTDQPPPTLEELIVEGEMSQAYYKAMDLLSRTSEHKGDANGDFS